MASFRLDQGNFVRTLIGTRLFVVFNDGEEANSFFSWVRPQARSVLLKYTRQIGTGT